MYFKGASPEIISCEVFKVLKVVKVIKDFKEKQSYSRQADA